MGKPSWDKSPSYPIKPTAEELCEFWKAMDAFYDTETNSPLHHDGRCSIHTEDRKA